MSFRFVFFCGRDRVLVFAHFCLFSFLFLSWYSFVSSFSWGCRAMDGFLELFGLQVTRDGTP